MNDDDRDKLDTILAGIYFCACMLLITFIAGCSGCFK